MNRTYVAALAAAVVAWSANGTALAAGPTFASDKAYSAAELAGLKSLGSARWSVMNGTLVGRPTAPAGGWLLLPENLSNLAGYLEFRCEAECTAGILFRAEQTVDGGLKGILLSAAPGGGIFAVQLDSQGRETTRTPVQKGSSIGGLASPIGNTPKEAMAAMFTLRAAPMPAGIEVPGIVSATGDYKAKDWNSINFIAYNDMLKPSLNGAAGSQHLPNSLAPASLGVQGAVALYVAGRNPVQFRNVQVKDLNKRTLPPRAQSANFAGQQLDGLYYSWGPAVADFDNDGKKDVVAGPFIYKGPDFNTAMEITTPVAYNPTTDYPQVSFISFAHDFDKDGWQDIVTIGGSGGYSNVVLYLNPKGASRHWQRCEVMKPVGNEETFLEDIDGDGQPELIHAAQNAMAYSNWDSSNPCGPWKTTLISKPGPWGAFMGHGIGVGDIDGDGRKDYLSGYGWWRQPETKGQAEWAFHPYAFGRRGEFQGGAGGAGAGIYDVNGDGLNDVVTPLEAHGFGLAWFEQKRGADGQPTFVQHTIMDGFLDKNAGNVMFTEPHASAYADIDGDGIKDLITGKRYMSHLMTYGDPDPFGAPVLYVYKVRRNPAAPGGAEFVPELVDNRSGVGSHLDVSDIDGDGRPDIATSGALGTFVFLNKSARAR